MSVAPDPSAPQRPASIVLVEDDTELRGLVADLLAREGWRVAAVGDGTAMERAIERELPDLLILDINLPGEDGLSICRRVGASGEVAILMLTARSEEIDRIVGLEIGADDYLGKPFHPRELTARVRALLRRRARTPPAPDTADAELRAAGLRIDRASRTAWRGKHALALTGAEFDLLLVLAGAKGRVLSRDHLLDRVHGRTAHPTDRAIDVLVSRLRRKIDPPGGPSLITGVRNAGYVLRDVPGA